MTDFQPRSLEISSDLWPTLATAAPAPISHRARRSRFHSGRLRCSGELPGLVPAGITRNTSNFPTFDDSVVGQLCATDRFPPGSRPRAIRLVIRGGAGSFFDLLAAQYTANALSHTGPLFGPPAGGAPTATLQNPWAIPPGVVPLTLERLAFYPVGFSLVTARRTLRVQTWRPGP